jgi:hypothetical protein
MRLTLNQKKSQVLFLQIILQSAHLEKVMEPAQNDLYFKNIPVKNIP